SISAPTAAGGAATAATLLSNTPATATASRTPVVIGSPPNAGGTAGLNPAVRQVAATSTRLSKNVAPPPRSVRAVLVVVLQFTPSAVYRFHHSPSVTTTPGFTLSASTAFARNRPRALNTVTAWPSAMPRAAASVALTPSV